MSYKAQIEFMAYEDDYTEGEGKNVANWDETIEADTQSELRNKVLDATYSKWEDLDDEQMNEYDWATEYHTGYPAIVESNGDIMPASTYEIEQFKLGKETLLAVNCHILVTEVTEKKATL